MAEEPLKAELRGGALKAEFRIENLECGRGAAEGGIAEIFGFLIHHSYFSIF